MTECYMHTLQPEEGSKLEAENPSEMSVIIIVSTQ
jgi:hypothetical protein